MKDEIGIMTDSGAVIITRHPEKIVQGRTGIKILDHKARIWIPKRTKAVKAKVIADEFTKATGLKVLFT